MEDSFILKIFFLQKLIGPHFKNFVLANVCSLHIWYYLAVKFITT